MTDEQETLVTIEFVDRGGATEIILTHERFSSENIMISHREGWNWMMDQLTTYL